MGNQEEGVVTEDVRASPSAASASLTALWLQGPEPRLTKGTWQREVSRLAPWEKIRVKSTHHSGGLLGTC